MPADRSVSFTSRPFACSLFLGASLGLLLVAPSVVRGEEPGGLQAALALEQVLERAIASAERSVVSIARVRKGEGQAAVGFAQPFGPPVINQSERLTPKDPNFIPNEFATGVVVDASGLVLTNFHVTDKEGSDHFITTSERKVFQADVIGGDARCDLAILKVRENPTPSDFVPMKFGNAKTLKKGQIVITLGNPYAIARDGQVCASWGIVSNLARKVVRRRSTREEPEMLHELGTLIQTDAKLNLGTSGGALINLRGEMVGLTTSLAAVSGYEQPAGFAIPIDDTFLRIINTLKAGREVEYGFLGIQPDNLLSEQIRSGKTGIRVGQVKPATPALRAGIRVEDVITHVNGEPVHDISDLRLLVGKLPAASTVSLTVERGGEVGVTQVHLAKFSVNSPPKVPRVVTVKDPAWRGLRVDFPSSVLGPEMLTDSCDGAVAVADVEPGSPAYEAGLRPSMLITHVGTTPLDTRDDFRREVTGRKGPVELTVTGQAGESYTITVPETVTPKSSKKSPDKK